MSAIITVPLTVHGRDDFDDRVEANHGGPLRARSIETVQVNIGLTCDLACCHCHVESSPKRSEQMDWQTLLLVLRVSVFSASFKATEVILISKLAHPQVAVSPTTVRSVPSSSAERLRLSDA